MVLRLSSLPVVIDYYICQWKSIEKTILSDFFFAQAWQKYEEGYRGGEVRSE